MRLGFLLNFTRQVEWPETVLPPEAPLMICLAPGDASMTVKAEELTKQKVQGHVIKVKQINRPTDAENCQVLYLPAELPAPPLANRLASQDDAATLTVSDSPDFIEAGGIIGLVLVGNRYRFDVNLGNARRAGLRISSYLLKLARTVK